MELTAYLRPVCSIVLFGMWAVTYACGPYSPIIPTPEFFALSGDHNPMSYYEQEENVRLWQALTNEKIPLKDIEDAVYHSSCDEFLDNLMLKKSPNKFYAYLNNSGDTEVEDLLRSAKQLEKTRSDMQSPWYYPQTRFSEAVPVEFKDIIQECKSYQGTRLRDRYGLQVVRGLFASRQYDECIEYADSVFSDISDNNLMKRMAGRYVAGCWRRLGDDVRADSLFALAGDVWSLSSDSAVFSMAERFPNTPQLIEYIRHRGNDTVFMRKMEPIVKRVLKRSNIANKGDWYYLLAYIDNEYRVNPSAARACVYRALQQKFSLDELRDLARVYKMKLDAMAGNSRSLVDDLKWIEGKIGVLDEDAYEWKRRICNIIYADWVPRLWKNRDYSTAILLCAYADDIYPYSGPSVYGSLSFQLMGSMSSAQLAAAYGNMQASTPLYDFLKRKARTDSDYYNEVIGTLALREGDYVRAERYLSLVSEDYQKTMNIYKDGYLSRDPFTPYTSRWSVVYYDENQHWEYDMQAARHIGRPKLNAKLEFARRMLFYKDTMLQSVTADERGQARLMYAIGRRNSFEECWALTQYWRGDYIGIFYPALQYWDDDFAERKYAFLYDYSHSDEYKKIESEYDSELTAALAMLTSDEARAKAEYLFGNVKTVVKYYGNTSTAKYIKTSCDNWESWL